MNFMRKSLLHSTAIILAASSIWISTPAHAQQSELQQLRDLIQQQQSQIQALSKKLEDVAAKQSHASHKGDGHGKKKDDVELMFEKGRPTIKSADGNFEMSLFGSMHYDMASYQRDDDNLPSVAPGRDLSSGANFRRAEVGLQGKLMRDFGYYALFDFGGSGSEGGGIGTGSGIIKDIYLSYNTFHQHLSFQIGALKTPMTLDESTSSNDIPFMERASPAAMAATFGAGHGRTSVGAKGYTDNFYGSAFYTGGVIGEGGVDEASNLVGRTAFKYSPNKETTFHVGASGTKVMEFSQAAGAIPPALQGASVTQFNLQDRPEVRVDTARLVSTGLINADEGYTVGPEFAAAWKNLNLQSEYYHYQLDRTGASSFDFDGWYVQGSWILTGESRKYEMKNARFLGPTPSSPLGFGGFGTWELGARYSTVDLNDGDASATCLGNAAQMAPTAASSCVRGGEQDIVTLGLNWYPNTNVRFMFNYIFVEADRNAYTNNAAGVAGGPNADIGQDVDIFALRSQFTF